MVEAAGTVPLMVSAAGDTHIGGREHNEDVIFVWLDLDLYFVADGAGGHNAGHIASAIAATTAAHYFESTQSQAAEAPTFDEMGLTWSARRLASAFQRANREVREISELSERCEGMGTTLVASHFDLVNATLVLGHVGDSRCYRLRDGHLERLTQDHSLINDVLEIDPEIDSERARALPRNVITNALGMEDRVRVSVRTHELVPGDRYLLCSDGLTDEVDDGQIQQAIALGSTPAESARLLIDLALDDRPRDNIAVVVLECRVAPGVGRLPTKPVPPTRHHARATPEATSANEEDLPSDEVEILEMDDLDDNLDERVDDPVDEEPVDDDEPLLEITMTERGAEQTRKRRDDDTIITSGEN